ncbi:MAG TPA: PIG-L family deacetylase [Candidatus Saccharimonadales bacterium]
MIKHLSAFRKSVRRLFNASRHINKRAFAWVYMAGALTILTATTIVWSIVGARINEHNADQLVGSFLFDHGDTFHGAQFPSQHSFLLKWPLFFLIRTLGSSALALDIVTTIISLLTVGGLIYVLYRIERRPLVFGTICLALASMLLLIPTESYPGALLPVNFAMLANRNIEYIFYIISLVMLIKSPRLIHWQSITSIALLAILFASDKLFLTFGLGGSIIALIIYSIYRHATYRNLAAKWAVASLVAAGLALCGLWLISISHLTSIVSSGTNLGPYDLVHNFKDLGLGIIYGLFGIFTNLGANPAANTIIATHIPGAIFHQLLSVSGIAYISNGLLAIGGLFAVTWVCRSSFRKDKTTHKKHRKQTREKQDTALQLSVTLIWTSIAALCVFIATNHYYAVDARYLTICLFAVSISGVVYLRRLIIKPRVLVAVGFVLVCSIGAGILTTTSVAHQSATAYASFDARNKLVGDNLNQHPVDILVGDYWRVLPIKLEAPTNQAILPLSNCLSPRDVLTSTTWHQDLTEHSFAYLLTTQPSITGQPGCTIDQVVGAYGRPNSSQVIAGTITKPEEVLLYYDNGIQKSAPAATPKPALTKSPSTSILPVDVNDLPNGGCTTGQTIVSVVAHQDDDLLFMNPDLVDSLRGGACIRSIYLTSGDAGGSAVYWLGREEGSKAAYAQMLGVQNPEWISRTIAISAGHYMTLAKIKGNPQVSLIFMHLPDGNIDGRGFDATHHESLKRLEAGLTSIIHSTDNQSSYSSTELISTLSDLMDKFQPQEIRTQAQINHSKRYPDHSDHLMAGWYTQRAYENYRQHSNTHVAFYTGYPIRDRPENISLQGISDKEAVFFTYAKYDKGACESEITCTKTAYRHYLKRQYKIIQP